MKYLLLLLLTASATVICAPVWQLGVEDGSSREFLPYSSLEFQTSRQLLKRPLLILMVTEQLKWLI